MHQSNVRRSVDKALYKFTSLYFTLKRSSTSTVVDRKATHEILSRYVTSHPGQLSLAIPSWVGAMSTSQRAVTPCGWGIKAVMVCMWVAGKAV